MEQSSLVAFFYLSGFGQYFVDFYFTNDVAASLASLCDADLRSLRQLARVGRIVRSERWIRQPDGDWDGSGECVNIRC